MSRITPILRALPRSSGVSTSRAVHKSSPSPAAAAAAPRPPPRRIAVAAAPRARPAPPAPAAAPTPKSAPIAQQSFDNFDGIADEDFSPPAADAYDDYTPPAAASPSASRPKPASSSFARSAPTGMNNVTPSPPLSTFPNDSYRPLPTTAAGDGVAGGLGDNVNDWSTSFSGLSQRPFDKEIADALLRPLSKDDVEVKPDGLLYLPEIKYRRTLNAAFGPGGWGLAPRGETHVDKRIVSREWGLVCLGRLVSVARGEQEYFDESGIPTATEACKSNALMRCCKDLGIASELWDPTFIRDFKSKHCVEVWVEHAKQKTKRKLFRKKDAPKFDYPYKETGLV